MRPVPSRVHPRDPVAPAERARHARVVVHVAARLAAAQAHAHAVRSRTRVALPCRVPSEPPVPWASARSQSRDLHRRVRLAAQLAHGLDDLRHAAAVGRVVVAQAAAVGVHREAPDAGDSVAVGDEPPALALRAEPQVLELHHDGDGERVVDRRVLDVRRRHACLLERRRARTAPPPTGEVDAPARRCASPPRPCRAPTRRRLEAAARRPGARRERAAAVAHDAAVEPVQRIGDERRVETSSTVTTFGSIACGLCWAWCDAATLTHASCSDVVPNSCMWRGRPSRRCWRRCAERQLVRHLGHRRVLEEPPVARRRRAARPPGQRDERDGALPGGDRLRGVADVRRSARTRPCPSSRRAAPAAPGDRSA